MKTSNLLFESRNAIYEDGYHDGLNNKVRKSFSNPEAHALYNRAYDQGLNDRKFPQS